MRKLLLILGIALALTSPALASSSGQITTSDYVDGITTPLPKVVHARPHRIAGTLQAGKHKMDFASGGNGWSIPYGDYPITPDAVGSWGERHHAIGINDGTIYDKQLGRDRDGIEIHASGHMASAGCVVVSHDDFVAVKKEITSLIGSVGRAFLHVAPDGAAITAEKLSPFTPFIYLADHKSDSEHKSASRETGKKHHAEHVRVAMHHHHYRHYAHSHYHHYASS